MLRNIIGRGGAVAAGGAAAAAPTTSHCRAAQPQHSYLDQPMGVDPNRGAVLTSGKDKEGALNVTDGGHLHPTGLQKVDQEWLVADVSDTDVLFGPEEVSEVINTVMGVPEREAARVTSSDVTIHEIDAQSDSGDSSGADDAMHAAGMQMAAYNAQHGQFIAALNNTMNRPDVQHVLLTALLQDPNVQNLLQDRNRARSLRPTSNPSAEASAVADAEVLLPAAARAGLQAQDVSVEEGATEEEHAFLRMAAGVADRIVGAAKSLRESAANVLIKLGFEIHGLLGRPFKPPREKGGSEEAKEDGSVAEWLPKVLMTVGCAVMTLLLFKRLRIV